MPNFTPPTLDQIHSPADLRRLERRALPYLATELRQFILHSVGGVKLGMAAQ